MTRPVVPPQNLEAEESVLGSMMLTPAAVSTAAEMLDPDDFYRESHGLIFAAAAALAERGEPVDAVTLVQELTSRGEIERVGGRVRIHEIARLVPASVNIAHYARIVHETATLRGLIAAGSQIAQLGWEGDEETPLLVEHAMEMVYGLADHDDRHGEGLIEAGPAIRDAFDRTRELAEQGSEVVGVPSGFPSIDRLTAGFHPGNLIIVAGRPSMGKRLRLDAPILAPAGWVRNGDLRPGDRIIGADGQLDTVTAVHDDPQPLDFYRVRFDDGATVECCGDHLWLTRTRNERRSGKAGKPRSTREIQATLRRADGHGWNHTIPYVRPVEFDQREEALPLDPYWLGLYLGDGDSGNQVRFTNPEEDLQGAFVGLLPPDDAEGATQYGSGGCPTATVKRRQKNNEQSDSRRALSALGLAGKRSYEKFIPDRYLRASVAERIALLQGICDTDGYVTLPSGTAIEISTSSPHLRDGIIDLVGGLGGRISCVSRPTHYRVAGRRVEARGSHRLVLSFPRGDIVPVRSGKHLPKWRGERLRGAERPIVAVEPCGHHPGRCITVGRGLYVTEGFAVTHNSGYALGVVANVILGSNPLPVAVFTMEMSPLEVIQRLQSLAGNIDSAKLRTGVGLRSEDWNRLATASGQLDQGYLFLDSAPVLTVAEIRARSRRLKLRRPALALIVVDYLQLMDAARQDRSRVQEVSEISRGLKQVAVELQVPVLALSQLSRNVEARHDKRPMLADLRESGSIEQDADVVLFLYRDEYYNPDTAEEDGTAGIAEVNIAKQRNGPTGTVKLSFVKRFARFSELPLPGVSS